MFRTLLRRFSYKLPGKVTTVGEVGEAAEAPKGYVRPIETYKPSQQIEFNKKGETLVYTCNVMDHIPVFLPMPYSLGTLFSITASAYAFKTGILGLYNFGLIPLFFLASVPHLRYLYNTQYYPMNIWYVRGGLWKFEVGGFYNCNGYVYTEPNNITLLTENSVPEPFGGKFAKILDEEGKLKRSLNFELDVWQDFHETVRDQRFKILYQGKVLNPELFQAMVQKYIIDDSDHAINNDPDNSPVSQKCKGE